MLSTLLSAIDKSEQHQEKYWECQYFDPGLLGEKCKCYLYAIPAPHEVLVLGQSSRFQIVKTLRVCLTKLSLILLNQAILTTYLLAQPFVEHNES